jgi:outer membrane receptor protein involved in Fe transport
MMRASNSRSLDRFGHFEWGARARILCVAFVLISSLVLADTKGKLSGRVTDEKNEPIVGANVLLVGTTMGAATDKQGYYAIINIPPGTYDVRISSLGFRSKIIRGVRISAGSTTTLNESLPEEVIQLGQEVVVVAERPVVDVKQTSSVAILSKEDIAVLPVQELKEIVNLQAGVVSSGDGLHFRGGRVGEVQFQVNGVSVNNAFNNQSSVSIDRSLIQEVQVISGTFDAEYGQAMSGVVNTVLKTGGERFEWNAELFSGGFLYDGAQRGMTGEFRPRSIQNFQLSIMGPTGIPQTNFIFSGRRALFEDYVLAERRFRPTDKSDFATKVYNPTGDGAKVPLGYSREWSGLAKITNRSLFGVEFGYQALVNMTEGRRTNFAYRYNPDGLSTQKNFSIVHGVDWTHAVSPSTFYTLSVRQNYVDYKDFVYESLYDARYDSAGLARGDFNYELGAIIQGVDFTRFIQKTNTAITQASLTSQVNRDHLLKFGAELQLHDVQFGVPGYLVFTTVQGRQALVRYENRPPDYPPIQRYKPLSFAAYAQDRMEWNDLTVRAGVRLEYFDARATLPSDLANPANAIEGAPVSVPKRTRAKIALAPRLAVSFPISVNASVFFSYGHFYQFPALGVVFSNANYSILEQLQAGDPYRFGVFGNPDIKPEKTVHYEFGYRHAVTDYLGLSANMFYKDIRDLLGVEFIETYTGAEYVRFTNVDFGNAFGFTLSLEQRRVGLVTSSVDYTLSIAQGNSSDPRETATRAAAGEDPRPRQIPLNWDQRHTLNVRVQLSEPEDYSVSLIGKLASGQPYTPALRPGFGGSIEPNSGRKPNSFVLDLRAEKSVRFAGFQAGLFLRVFNVLDTRFFNGFVFQDTGSPDYSATPGAVLAQLADPTRFYPPRRVEFGLTVAPRP